MREFLWDLGEGKGEGHEEKSLGFENAMLHYISLTCNGRKASKLPFKKWASSLSSILYFAHMNSQLSRKRRRAAEEE